MKPAGCMKKGFLVIFSIALLLFTDARLSPQAFGEEKRTGRRTGEGEIRSEIEAGRLSYDAEKRIYIAVDDVVITRENQVLSSQAAEYDESTGTARVPGSFRLEVDGDVLTGRDGVFDLLNETGHMEDGQLFLADDNAYMRAKKIEKLGAKRFLMSDCLVTTCEGECPTWSIAGSEVDVTLEGYGKVNHASFRIRNVPVLYIPYFLFPAKIKRQSGLLPPTFGYSDRTGADLEIPFFWAISDSTDATFYQRYLTRRGYMQGLEYRYMTTEDSRGSFMLDVLSDRRDIKNTTDPDEIDLSPFERTNTTRYWARGRADQELPLDIQGRLDVDFVSDQDYLREFKKSGLGLQARPDLESRWDRPFEEIWAPFRRSALRLSRDGGLYSLQAGMEYYQRPESLPDDPTPQPLGSMMFDLLPRRILETPVYAGMRTDFDHVWREHGATGYRTSVSPAFSIPFTIGPYLQVEPFSEYTIAHQRYQGSTGGNDTRTRHIHDSGLQLSTAFDRIFRPGFFQAAAVKHRLRPELTYRYRGPGDAERPAPWYEPVDQEGRLNQVVLSLKNFLDARYDRDEKTTYRQWGYLYLDQAYSIDRAREDLPPGEKREPFDPLMATLGINPGSNLRGRFSAEWDHYEKMITTTNASLDMAFDRKVGGKDYYSLDYSSNRLRNRKHLGISCDIYLVNGISVGGTFERELKTNDNVIQQAWLGLERQCWGMKFAVERSDRSVGFSLMVNLKGLGEFGSL
ncbi:MAG TPA: LPS-assembly protein LptD [Desulfobacteraceae bacterium]|nr:LPS-assembly protein LptD [Desulfobacteraceae bacterium]